jgi:hypothetical protein
MVTGEVFMTIDVGVPLIAVRTMLITLVFDDQRLLHRDGALAADGWSRKSLGAARRRYAMHLQSGYAGFDRPRRQREHYATDTDAVRI